MRYVGTAISIRQAFKEVKAFEWDGEYRAAARAAIKAVLEGKMENCIEEHLEEMEVIGIADRRNGHYERHILTEAGDVVVAVQRTRLGSWQEDKVLWAAQCNGRWNDTGVFCIGAIDAQGRQSVVMDTGGEGIGRNGKQSGQATGWGSDGISSSGFVKPVSVFVF